MEAPDGWPLDPVDLGCTLPVPLAVIDDELRPSTVEPGPGTAPEEDLPLPLGISVDSLGSDMLAGGGR